MRLRLSAPAGRVVAALDSLSHFDTLPLTSFHCWCIQYRRCVVSTMQTPPRRRDSPPLRRDVGRGLGAWSAHADFIDRRAAPLTERMLELAALQPGERVLELAAGAGGLGIAAAQQAGSVVISDIAPGMIAAASERARGLGNVRDRAAGSRGDRRAGRQLRRRALPRRADARPRPGPRGRGDPPRRRPLRASPSGARRSRTRG